MDYSIFSNKQISKLVFVFIICFFLISLVSAGNFGTSERNLKFKVIPGETQEISFNINNLETGQFSLIANPSWATVQTTSFLLVEGEQKEISVKVDSTGLTEGVYVSSIIIKSDNDLQVLPLILEVQSADTFFGGSLEIPLKYQEITSTDTLLAQVRIYDLISSNSDVKLGPTSVEVTYSIYSINGDVISKNTEKVTVENKVQISKVISFNKDVSLGTYVLATNVKYGQGVATSTALFNIKNKSFFNFSSLGGVSNGLLYIILILCLIILAYVLYGIWKWNSLNREGKRIDIRKNAKRMFR